MVFSKKCKICTVVDTNNVSISGEYFGKLIPELILKISGIELDIRKANGILICHQCIIQLVHTDMVIEKLRNTLQRLKTSVKQVKPRISLNDSPAAVLKTVRSMDKTAIGTDSQDLGIKRKLAVGKTGVQTLKTPKKATPKSIYRDENSFHKTAEINKNDPESPIVNSSTKMTIDSHIMEQEHNEGIKTDSQTSMNDIDHTEKLTKTSKIGLKRKSAFPAHTDKNIAIEENIETTNVKFKKFLADVIPAERKSLNVSKCKSVISNDEITNKFSVENDYDISSTKMRKENKSDPASEDGNDKRNINETVVKIMNCILCDKIFYSKAVLRNHIETAHMGERLKACPHCSSEFRSLQKYETHVFREKCKNAIHVCQYPQCEKRFKTVYKMELHMREKHSSHNESECY